MGTGFIPTRPKFEIVQAPNHLKARTEVTPSALRGYSVEQMVTRGEIVIEQASDEYEGVVNQDLNELIRLSEELQGCTAPDPRLVHRLYGKAFDIKSHAGTFHYLVLSEIAGSLCEYIEAMEKAKQPIVAGNDAAMTVLNMHVDSLRLARERDMRGPMGAREHELVDGLARVIGKTAVDDDGLSGR